jgi:Flp pilus assembly protein TadG
MPSSIRSEPTAQTRVDHGQAAVEFAIALPIVIVLVLGVIQVVLIGARQAAVERLARVGARAAAVAADPAAAAQRAVDAATGLEPIVVSVDAGSGVVTVTVAYTDPTSVPVVGAAIGEVELTATASMPREPP